VYHPAEADYLTRRRASLGVRAALSKLVPETGPMVLFKGLLENAPKKGVRATRHVREGDVVLDEFDVVETPGHTTGHVSYFYRPGKVLFAGDALAVIAGRLRFMARPVTPDLPRARESMLRLVDLPADHVCPGHREPLVGAVPERERMKQYIAGGGKWPLFG
jgi:glyoxylase-like metal-dependent hydrolase (beta-lactamase superfamily II)